MAIVTNRGTSQTRTTSIL